MQKKSLKLQEHGSSVRTLGPLDFARNLEIKGATLYLGFAAEAENLLTKQLFYSLAAEEIEHARKIDSIHAALRENQGWRPEAVQELPSVEKKLKVFFQQAGKRKLKTDTPSTVSYELAMEMERSGFKAYTDFHARAKDPAEKEFFRQLLQEEQEHLDALVNVYRYLTDTSDWLQEDESRTWNWMNL